MPRKYCSKKATPKKRCTKRKRTPVKKIRRKTISWSKTFPITLQLSIDFATLILSGFHQKWTIFGPLNGSGQSWLSEYFVRLAQKQLLLWCDEFERNVEALMRKLWQSLFMSFRRRWTRFGDWKVRRYLPTLILRRALSHANAPYALPDSTTFKLLIPNLQQKQTNKNPMFL